MTPSNPVRLVGTTEQGPSDPVRIVNFGDVEQLQQFDGLSENVLQSPMTLSYSHALVGGVRQITLHYTAARINIAGDWYDLPTGSILINSGHVVNPTLYYVYAHVVGGAIMVMVSVTDPEVDPTVNYEYAWISLIRIKETAGTAIIYYLRNASTYLDLFVHHAGEWDLLMTPLWVDGGGITITPASGVVDMETLEYRRLRSTGSVSAITAGALLIEDETIAYANLELITTYADGSPITAGRYHKLLIGVLLGQNNDYAFMIIRQGLPAVEYTTLAEATADALHAAGDGFPVHYRGVVFPLAYIVMLVGDASDLTTVDLRATGLTGSGGGGGTPITDHGALTGLGDDDHNQYALTDGTRPFTGPLDIGGNDIGNVGDVDGVNVGSHTHSGVGVLGLQIPSTSVSDFVEAAQDAVGAMVANSADVALTYTDATPSLIASLITRGELGVVLANGVNNNINIGTALLIRVTGPTASFSVDGFTGGYAGRTLYVYNAVAQNMTANNEAGTSAAANRILTLGGGSATVGVGLMKFIYSAIDSRWILVTIRA